jgi:hypothetical protein
MEEAEVASWVVGLEVEVWGVTGSVAVLEMEEWGVVSWVVGLEVEVWGVAG